MPGDASLFSLWPFTGQRAELAQLALRWRTGSGQTLVGAPGSGRSRLARRLAEQLGVEVVAGVGWRPELGRVIVDDAEHLSLQARGVAGGMGCLLVLPPWAPTDSAPVVTLAPLDASQVSTLLHRVLVLPVGAATVAQLALTSRGNVRSLVELTRGSRESGVLIQQDGTWHLTSPPRPTRLLIERVEGALAVLLPDEREELDLIALGEPLDRRWLLERRPRLVEAVLSCPLVSGTEVLRMRDDTSRQAVLDALPSLRARRLARELLASGLGDPGTRAVWADLAGAVIAPDDALAAARQLLASGEATRAHEILARTPEDPGVQHARAALRLHLGQPVGDGAAGGPDRLAAAASLVGGRRPPEVGPVQTVSQPEGEHPWPAADLQWDPFPSQAAVEAILAARCGPLGPGAAHARRALARAGSGWGPDLVWAALALGWVALAVGRPATARRRGLDLAAAADQLGWSAISAMGGNMAAVADGWLGQHGGAREDVAPPVDPVLAGWSHLWRIRAAAWSAGDHAGWDDLAHAAHEACDRGDLVTGAELASDLRRLGNPRVAREVLDRCRSGPPVADVEHVAAEAAVSGNADLWAQAAQGFNELGAQARAGECLVQLGLALGGARGAAAQVRADDLLAGCEGLGTPLVSRAHAVLTPREREVARMAAYGEASSQIAERLAISVRTVDNLLARCYVKLQIPGRRDLPEALGMVEGTG